MTEEESANADCKQQRDKIYRNMKYIPHGDIHVADILCKRDLTKDEIFDALTKLVEAANIER